MDNNSIEYNPFPPLKTLPSYKRWPVETLYSPLLGVLIRVTFIDYRTFPLNCITTYCPKLLPIPAVSPHTLSGNLISLSTRSHPFLSPHAFSQPIKILLFSISRNIHAPTDPSSSLANLSGSMDCSLVIIYLITNIYLFVNTHHI